MKFFSKAHTLKKLKIKNSIIPKIHIFKFKEYKLIKKLTKINTLLSGLHFLMKIHQNPQMLANLKVF